MQILDGGGEAQRRERVQADAGQSWMLAAQATRKQGCQDVDSCRDGHVRTTTTASPGVQRVRPPLFAHASSHANGREWTAHAVAHADFDGF
jgi:hypothetical protein